MAEKIIEKLDNLNEYAKILLARRIKKNSLQGFIKEKTSVAPLVLDFQLESEEAIIAKSTSTTVSKSTENKSHGIKKTKRYISCENKPQPTKSNLKKLNLKPHLVPTNIKNQEGKAIEPVEEYLKSRFQRPLLFLKDIDEAEYAKPLRYLHSQHRQGCRRTQGPTTPSVPSTQSNTYKKEKDAVLFTVSAQTEKNPKELFDLVGHLEDYVNESSYLENRLPAPKTPATANPGEREQRNPAKLARRRKVAASLSAVLAVWRSGVSEWFPSGFFSH
ncbi:uncharacterized protein C1orf141 homolog [Artibeus jamaicensis]|uniref:uncharacterized protein C1orf141 homolog n=1 Tax=Artibeus jamaicensis TaxID=9417 RepID=UPI00235A5B18|nr:uncharacterized protein C1orf141 homolog [Artibeus jamaicensis]